MNAIIARQKNSTDPIYLSFSKFSYRQNSEYVSKQEFKPCLKIRYF